MQLLGTAAAGRIAHSRFCGALTHQRLIDPRGPGMHALVDAWFRAPDWWRARAAGGSETLERRLQRRAGDTATKGVRLPDRDENRRAPGATPEPDGPSRAGSEHVESFLSRGMLARKPLPAGLPYSGFIE